MNSKKNKFSHTCISIIKDQRLDLYLENLRDDLSRSQIQRLIQNKKIKVNNLHVKKSFALSNGDVIDFDLSEIHTTPVVAFQQNIPIEIIFEDSEIIVVNKPHGLVTHPGAGNTEGTLVNALFNKLLKNDLIRPGVVHRLDKDTSGLIVLAKTDAAYNSLSQQFKTKEARRTYWALCFGKLKNQSGQWRSKLSRKPSDRKKFSSQEEGREAITHFRVLKEAAVSLVELNLETGRTHQIRIHLSEAGHPILNDPIYGSVKKINDLHDPLFKARVRGIKRLALVAKELSLKHPTNSKNLSFKIPWPDEFEIF